MARLETTGSDSDVPRDETGDLISSDKVEGTAVYGSDGNKIGRIETVMIGKRDGRVAYAVLSFGGFLGLGDDHYPLPWSVLTYDESLGGYRINMTEDQIKGAPRYSDEADWDWGGDRLGTIDTYYGTSRYSM